MLFTWYYQLLYNILIIRDCLSHRKCSSQWSYSGETITVVVVVVVVVVVAAASSLVLVIFIPLGFHFVLFCFPFYSLFSPIPSFSAMLCSPFQLPSLLFSSFPFSLSSFFSSPRPVLLSSKERVKVLVGLATQLGEDSQTRKCFALGASISALVPGCCCCCLKGLCSCSSHRG